MLKSARLLVVESGQSTELEAAREGEGATFCMGDCNRFCATRPRRREERLGNVSNRGT